MSRESTERGGGGKRNERACHEQLPGIVHGARWRVVQKAMAEEKSANREQVVSMCSMTRRMGIFWGPPGEELAGLMAGLGCSSGKGGEVAQRRCAFSAAALSHIISLPIVHRPERHVTGATSSSTSWVAGTLVARA